MNIELTIAISKFIALMAVSFWFAFRVACGSEYR